MGRLIHALGGRSVRSSAAETEPVITIGVTASGEALIRGAITIQAPTERVWSIVDSSDVEIKKRLAPALVEIKWPDKLDRKNQVGARHSAVFQQPSGRVEVEYVTTRYEPNKLLSRTTSARSVLLTEETFELIECGRATELNVGLTKRASKAALESFNLPTAEMVAEWLRRLKTEVER